MSTYTNLTQDIIDRTTAFFNTIDVNGSGSITIQQIIDSCIQDTIKSYKRLIPPWLSQLSEDYTPTSMISEQDYNTKRETTQDLFLNFSEIDTDQNNQITFQQLYDKYLDLLSPLPIDHYYPSKIFIELIKSDNNLTNESSITLEQLLSYENQHNVTRYWPL
jgi:Ca2+-binding EF-hand superfamily protein